MEIFEANNLNKVTNFENSKRSYICMEHIKILTFLWCSILSLEDIDIASFGNQVRQAKK